MTRERREGEREFRVFTQSEVRSAQIFLWSQVSPLLSLSLPENLFDGTLESVLATLEKTLFYYRDHPELTREQRIGLAYFLIGVISRNFWRVSTETYELMSGKVEEFREIIDLRVFLIDDPLLPSLVSLITSVSSRETGSKN